MKYILKSDLKEMFFVGESFAVGDQKVCAKSILKFKYKKQTFWNTNSGGKKQRYFDLSQITLIFTDGILSV